MSVIIPPKPGGRHTALRVVTARNARHLARKTKDMLQGRAVVQGDEMEEFWALKNVSLEVQQGDKIRCNSPQ